MAGNYIQRGEIIHYTASAAAVSSGTVVAIGNILGVALGDIEKTTTGVVQITGVFEVPKVKTAEINAGESLLWDSSAAAFDASSAIPATGDISGPPAVAFADAGSSEETLLVRFTGVPGTTKI